MSLTTSLRKSFDFDGDFAEAWRRLVDDSTSASLFQTWEWQSAWWRHYHGSKKPLILAFHEGDDLVGLMPMAVTSGLWKALTPIGHGKSDYLHPIARRGWETRIGEAVAGYLMEANRYDVISLSMVRETEPLAQVIDPQFSTPMYDCYVLDLPKDYDLYVRTLGESLQRYLRRFQKRADAEGLTLEIVNEGQVEGAMEALFDLHSQRWRQKGSAGGFAFRRLRALYHDWARQAMGRGWLRLIQLKSSEKPIGVILSASLNGTYYYHNIGFDPARAELRPGWVLIGASIRQAIESGDHVYDFMLGDEPYKAKWLPQRKLANMDFRIVQPGWRSALAEQWYGKGLASLVKARRRLAGLARGAQNAPRRPPEK